MKLQASVEKIIIIILSAGVIFAGTFSMIFSKNIQLTKPFQQGYYKVFKDEELIGNIEKIDDIRNNLLKKYGNKANLDIYFGDGISVEYVQDGLKDAEFTSVEKIVDILDVRVDGLIVKTFGGQVFNVTSYNDWRKALGNVVEFVAENDAEKYTVSIDGKGDVKVAENFTYAYEKIPIAEVMDADEAEDKLLYNDTFNIKTDIVQSGDTIQSLAERNNMSVAQVKYANNVKDDNMLVPGTVMNVSDLNYAVNFSYPIIENVLEEIAFEIEYVEDAELYVGTEEIKQAGVNGKAKAKYISNIINGESVPGQRLEYEMIEEPVKQIVHKGTKVQQSATTTTGAGEIKTDAPYANEAGFIWPTIGICISAEYGWYEYGAHKGLDIAGSGGESIWAAAAGTVESAEYSGAFGNQVLVNHNNGLKTRYAHLQSIGVNKGQEVKQGQYVGGMGSTGMSEANHLHFEVHANGERLNPRGYLPAGGPKKC